MAAKHPSSASSFEPSPKQRQLSDNNYFQEVADATGERIPDALLVTLRYSDSRKSLVQSLWCAACKKYEDKMCGVKNFSSAWIVGSSNQKVSNVLDHARSKQHKVAMTQLRAEQARASNAPVTSYAPIARSLLSMES